MMKLVSVIIPAYNAEKYISDAINSVLNQSYSNFELIIVNDGSTDKTGEIINMHLPHPRINYIEQKNKGVSSARNSGMQNAKGEYFTFLDADDCFEPANLELKIKLLEQNQDCYFCYGDAMICNEFLKVENTAKSFSGNNLFERLLLWDSPGIVALPSNIIIRKQCYADEIRFDCELSTAADQLFAFCISNKYKGIYINKALVKYRVLAGSMSRNIKLMEKDHILVYKKAKEFGFFKSYWFQKKCYANLYLILAGSWWRNGRNKFKGFIYIMKSIVAFPPVIIKLTKKVL